jgi:hypothetical protein
MSFSTYITFWDKDPYAQVQDMISKNALTPNTRIILAFASFNFSSTDYIPGLGNMTIDSVKQLTTLVHNNNANISLSIGGATYPFSGSDLYSKPGDLASNINTVLNTCGFDGVDFDIEDPGSGVPSDFVNNTSSLINTLRSLNSNLYITLTTAAQAWAPDMWQQQVINYTIGNLNAWQPMEYDLWISPSKLNPTPHDTNSQKIINVRDTKPRFNVIPPNTDYYNQVQYDINYYITTWGVNPDKIVLGLMPGKDDLGHDLSLENALNLTTFATQQGLHGVMTWDANNDSHGIDNNAPYAYNMGISSQLKQVEIPNVKSCCNIV